VLLRGIGEEMLVVARGVSVASDLVRNAAMVATETTMAPRSLSIKTERIRVTNNGKRALDGRPLFERCGKRVRGESARSRDRGDREGARYRGASVYRALKRSIDRPVEKVW
jgi:hypothetical protein